MDNISLFLKLFKEKKNEIHNSLDTLKKGSIKLSEMGVIVEKLKIELVNA